jgi:chromate transporter
LPISDISARSLSFAANGSTTALTPTLLRCASFCPAPASSQVGFVLGIFRGEPNGLTGAIISVIALSLPGLLLVYGTLPFWDGLRRRPTAQAAMKGANAAVVGILAAAFYSPVWSSAVVTPTDFSLHLPASCS